MYDFVNVKWKEWRADIPLICICTFVYFGRYSFMSFAKSFHISTALVGAAILVLLVGSLVLYTGLRADRVCWEGVLLFLAVALFFRATLALHPEYEYRYLDAYHEGKHGAAVVFKYGAGLYTYYFIRLFQKDGKKLYRLLSALAYVILCFDIWVLFLNRTEEYKMGFGFQMELAAILFLAMFLQEGGRLWHLALSLACIAAGILYGSRACILGYGAFALVYMAWKRRVDIKQAMLVVTGCLGVSLMATPTIMALAYRFFSSLGLHSRTLYYLAANDILGVDRSRQEILWPRLLEALRQSSFFHMYGALGDRTLFSMYYPYAHNFVLEILLTFGKALGGLFLAWMALQFVQAIRKNRDEAGLVAIIFGCFVLCKLFLSATFWEEPYFWSFLAMLRNCAWARERGHVCRNA